MYGSNVGLNVQAAASGALAYTGFSVGVWMLATMGLVVGGFTLIALVRKPGQHRP